MEVREMDEIYERLATKLGYPDSKYLPKIYDFAVSMRQAKILELLNQAPGPALTAEQLSETLGIEANEIQQDLEDLFHKGLAFMQLHDAMISGWKFHSEPEKLFKLWREYDENEGYEDYAKGYTDVAEPLMRVIPAWRSVENDANLQPWEDWREILKSKQLISVVDCPCRLEVGACDRPTEVCLDFDRTSEYDVASGHGRIVSLEEALQIMDDASRSGLVPNGVNSANVTLMCNCCSDCCVGVKAVEHIDLPISRYFTKSRYEAKVNQDICDGCQNCIDNCNFDAIDMVKVPDSKKLKAQIDTEACFGCGCCFMVCEPKAISMECVRPVAHVPGIEG
jgi:Pyruvate/2-oxoacid:ferredoxin oxidoreductase delta subunit